MAVEKFTDLPSATPVAADLACIVTVPGDISSKATVTSLVPPLSVDAGKLAANGVITTKILDANVTNAKLADMAAATVKGRALGAGTGVPTDLTASQLATILGVVSGANPSTNNFRPTLATALPVYAPQSATPASTDTGAETTTFSPAPGWVTGTIVTVSATVGGLTAGTRYFLHMNSSTVCTYHTNVADAESGGSPVNLSANITSVVIPSGVSSTTLRFTPYNGNRISLQVSSVWTERTSSEMTLAVGTRTANLPYDVFCYDNAGTPTLELLAWTSATVRATDITILDGVPVKSGDSTRRLVFTFVPDSTTTAIDDAGGIGSQVGGKRRVAAVDNQVMAHARVFDNTNSWAAASGVRQANANAGNQCDFAQPLLRNAQTGFVTSTAVGGAVTWAANGVGVDSTTAMSGVFTQVTGLSVNMPLFGRWEGFAGIGLHTLMWLEASNGTASVYAGDLNDATRCQSGLSVMVFI